MNILRIIKLKQISGELDSLNDREKFFLSFFNRVVESRDEDVILFFREEHYYYFSYNVVEKIFFTAYNNVMTHIILKCNMDYEAAVRLMMHVLNDHLGIEVKEVVL